MQPVSHFQDTHTYNNFNQELQLQIWLNNSKSKMLKLTIKKYFFKKT